MPIRPNQTMKTDLIPGAFYTVKSGRFKGRTGRAFSYFGEPCEKLWFPESDLHISFCLSLSTLRPATPSEELRLRRWVEQNS